MLKVSNPLGTNKVAGIYCRVSTKEQTLGYSLDEQKHRCREYLKTLDQKYHRIYVDDGYTGKTLQRPAMQKLIGDIIAGKISHVVVWKLDRLSRNLTDTLFMVEELDKAGVGVISVTQAIDTTTTIGKIVISVLSGFSQIELENISDRVRMGVTARRRDGKWCGSPPYGYDYDKESGKLVMNPKESKIVRQIFKRYLKYESAGRVRKYLIDQGIPTRGGNGWSTTTIGAILARKTYIGSIKSGETEVRCPELRLISKRTFKAAQKLRKARAGLSPAFKKRKAEIYSEGYFCGNCGAFMDDGVRYCGECGGNAS
jgi:site-specific DNA recombinase